MGRPLGRGVVLLRAGARGVAEDRQHGRRRRWRASTSPRSSPTAASWPRPRRCCSNRCRVWRASAVSLLPGRLPLAARASVAARRPPRRGASPLRRGQGALPARRRGAGSPGRRCPDRGVPGRHGGSRRCARTGGCHAEPGPIVEWDRQGRAAAGTRARLMRCSSKGTMPVRGRRCEASLAAGRTRRDPFEVALTLLALIQLDRRGGRRARTRGREREPLPHRQPEGPGRPGGAARRELARLREPSASREDLRVN